MPAITAFLIKLITNSIPSNNKLNVYESEKLRSSRRFHCALNYDSENKIKNIIYCTRVATVLKFEQASRSIGRNREMRIKAGNQVVFTPENGAF